MCAIGPTAAACSSGPDFCTDDPRIPAALQEKKDRLSNQYPARLIVLLDRGTQCIARIQQEPDGFSLIIIRPNGKVVLSWDEDNEIAAKKEIVAGTVKRFWIVNAARAFSCDGQPRFDKQPDYDAADDVNTSLAIKCESSDC